MIWLPAIISLGIIGGAGAQYSKDRPQYFQELQVPLHVPNNRTQRNYTNGPTPDIALLDHRYASTIAVEEHSSTLRLLLAAFFFTMGDLGVESWLAHDTLLGWYESEKLLTSTKKLNVQISSDSLIYLVRYYNMSVYQFGGQREYLIDIHPDHRGSNGRRIDSMVDARWVGMNNGIFLDISAVGGQLNHSSLQCNDGSTYDASDVYPLREVFFANATVNVPNRPERILDAGIGNLSYSRP